MNLLQPTDYKNVESIDNKVIKHVCSKTYFQTECNQSCKMFRISFKKTRKNKIM